jgi:hypothetical protein
MDVRLYIYDTHNGWCAQAKTVSDAFHVAATNLPCAIDTARKLVATTMALQAQCLSMPQGTWLQLPSTAADRCIRYLASTQTFEHVSKAYGSPSGHWLALVYRFEDHEPILSPAFFVHPSETLSRPAVASWVAQIVERDRNAPDSEVHQLVFNGKGPKLSPLLR